MYCGSDENLLYECKYFDVELKKYVSENFLESVLILDDCK